MPSPIVEVSQWDAAINVPLGTEPRTAASVRTPFQSVGNRLKWLKDLIDGGVQKLRTVADVAALKALAAPAGGQIAIVANVGPFFFRPGSPIGSDLTGLRYDSTAGGGYWYSPLYYAATTVGGLARLDVSVLPPPNRVVSFINAADTTSPQLAVDSNGAWQSSGFSTAVSLALGDVLDIAAHFSFGMGNAVDECRLRLVSDDQSHAVVPIVGSDLVVFPKLANTKTPVVLRGQFTPTYAGTQNIMVQFSGPGGGPVSQVIAAVRSFKGVVYRP